MQVKDFTSLEYMDIEEFNPNDWAKDYYLTDEILKDPDIDAILNPPEETQQ